MFGKKNGVKSNNSQSILGSTSASWTRNDSSRRGSSFSSGVGKSSPRIDPEILLDTQSSGLSSRIVKYYEENQKMSRSPRTIYNKPGQFPIVHLKKNEISYSPKRNNSLSVVKIAPPDKSVSDRNLRLNILRQGLSIPSTPSDDYLEPRKYDNEPLTPSEGIESTPTRSVLDALTEISRKRIHNEDFTGDRSKKHCKDATEVDGPQPGDLKGGQVKRQRDKVSPPSAETLTPVESSKKKVCRDSHDILSSLSSSVRLLNPKRRIEDVIAGDAKRTYYQRPQATVEPKKRSPIASVEPQRRPDLPSSQRVAQLPSTPVTVLPPKPPPKPTPKVTLFNQNYDKIQDRVLSDTEDDEERRSMNLVRPKQSSQLLVKDKEATKKGTKSKLAMMLSYLSRNIDEESEDTVDSKEKDIVEKKEESIPLVVPPAEQKTPEVSKALPVISFTAATATSTPVVLNIPTVTPSKPTEEVKEKEKEAPLVTSTPLFKFGVSPAKTETAEKAPLVSVAQTIPVVQESKSKEVEEPAKKLEESPVPLQFKPLVTSSLPTSIITTTPAPAMTSPSLSFTALAVPIFGSPATPAAKPTSMTTQVTPVTSVTTVVSSSAFTGTFGGCNMKFGATSEDTKTSSTFTMTPGIATSALAAGSSLKTPSFPGGKMDFGFASQPAASLSTASSTPSSTASLFTFKPVVTSAATPVATAAPAPAFSFGAPTSQATTTAAEINFIYPRNPETVADPAIKPTFVAKEYKKPISMITFGDGNVTKTTASGFPTTATSTFTPATTGGFSTSFTGFSGSSTPATSPPAYEAPKSSVDTKAMFTFGGATTTTQSQTSQGSPFVFSSPQDKPATTISSSTPFAFQKKTTPFDAPPAATNVFGTPNQTIFGSAASTASVSAANPVFGASASVPVFGAAASTASTTSTTNAFGTGSSVFSGGSPFGGTFGGFGTPTNNNNAKPPTTTSSASPFTFGTENKTPVAANPAPGIFGGSQTAAPSSFGTTEKPFNFGGAAQAPFQFGGATSTTTPAPFGFSTPSTSAQTPFGGAPANSFGFGQQTETPKPPPPAFGSNVTVFGGGAQQGVGNAPPAFGATNPTPAFNFSASNPGQQQQQQPFAFGATNSQGGAPMFSIGSNGGPQTAQRRPYRHATRRLK